MTKQQNLQDLFLNAARKQRTQLNLFLVNGIKLVGTIQSFDNYVILLSSTKGPQVVYKHAVSTIAPMGDLHFDPSAPAPVETEGTI